MTPSGTDAGDTVAFTVTDWPGALGFVVDVSVVVVAVTPYVTPVAVSASHTRLIDEGVRQVRASVNCPPGTPRVLVDDAVQVVSHRNDGVLTEIASAGTGEQPSGVLETVIHRHGDDHGSPGRKRGADRVAGRLPWPAP